jgi:Chaperone of endosialidase
MQSLIQFKRTTLLFLIPLALACFALVPTSRAVSPPPDGGYPGGNTAEGFNALFSLTSGRGNTAIGEQTLYLNEEGGSNTAIGFGALHDNITSGSNTAIGYAALHNNTTGNFNTATGVQALHNNTTGYNNMANGVSALDRNTTGNFNTANGFAALNRNDTGNSNTADGAAALFENTTGKNNTATGNQALNKNTTGNFNIALGSGAGSSLSLTSGSNNIDIGNEGVAGEQRTIRIGSSSHTRTFVAGISGVRLTGAAVVVNTDGQLGTTTSSKRFKDEVKPMDKASEAILALKPVTFHYKKEIDPERTPQFGLVAEEVEKVNPDLVVRDKEGKPYSVRYDQVNAMLLNEFLKEHRKVQEFEANAVRQQKQIEALTAGLQKVSAQFELSKPAPRAVLNNQ